MALIQLPTARRSSAATRGRTGMRARLTALVAAAMTVTSMGFTASVSPVAADPVASSDATLSQLSFTANSKAQSFFPTFTPTWTMYTVSLRAEQLTFGCTFAPTDPGATVTVAPACSSITFKKNVYATKQVTINVTAADGVTKYAYKVTVVHSLPINSSAALKTISSKGYKLTPKFNGKKSLFYRITTKPRAARVTIRATGAGAAKATVVNPKQWSTNGLNFVTINTKAGKFTGGYTVAILVPAYPTVTQSNVQDIAGGFSTDVNVINGTVNVAKTVATLAPKQKASCYDLGDPAVAVTSSGSVSTVFVTNVATGCVAILKTAITPALNFLPVAPAVTTHTVLNLVGWTVSNQASTLDGFTADFSVVNAEVTCTIPGSTRNYCTFNRNADTPAQRDGRLNLTGRTRDTDQTVTVSFTPDAQTAPKAPVTISAHTLKDIAGVTLGTATTGPGGFSVPITLKPGTVADATIALSAATPECTQKSRPRLKVQGTSNVVSALHLTSSATAVDTTIMATGVFTNCFATITVNVTGNTGYATPTIASEQVKTVSGIGGVAIASFHYTVDRTTDGYVATYDTFGGSIACPTVADARKATRIVVTCDATTVTVSGALPGETVDLSVAFTTDNGFTPPAGPLTITGQAKLGVATLNVNLDSLSKLGEGFRFNITTVHCTPSVAIIDYTTVDVPTVTVAAGVVTVSGMKLDPTNPGADRTATVEVSCTPDTGFDAPEVVDVPGITAAFNGIFNVKAPTLTVDSGDAYTKVPGSMTVNSDITDWVFPPTSSLDFTYRWERSLKTDPTQVCTNFVTMPDWTDQFYFAQPMTADTCVRVWVTPVLTDKNGNVTTGDAVVTNSVPIEIVPSYQRTNPLPHASAVDASVVVGSAITTTIGYWNGLAGARANYQWQRCDVNGAASIGSAQSGVPLPPIVNDCTGAWVNINKITNPTAASKTFYVTEDEIGANLRAIVTITNDLGTASMASDVLAVPATTDAIASAPGSTPVNLTAPVIAPAWNNKVVMTRPLEVVATGVWTNGAGLGVDWAWQYLDTSDPTATWTDGEYYVDVNGNQYPNAWGATTLPGNYRVVEFLVDPDGNEVYDVNGNRVETYSNVITVTAPVLGGP